MEKTMKLLGRVFTFLLLAVTFAACSSDDDSTDGDGNIKPDVNVNDPVGTVSLSMMKGHDLNEGATYIGNSSIHIGNDYNFNGGYFISLGTVKGLGNVSYIPTTGWADMVSVRSGNGYVAYSYGTFYRIYVEKKLSGLQAA